MRKQWRQLSPVSRGICESIAVIAVATTVFSAAIATFGLSHPSAALFRDLMQVGIGVFLAFVVATASARLRAGEALSDHLNWLGQGCGLGIAGFAALVGSAALAAYREAGHASALDIVGLSWMVASLLTMGTVVAALPYAAYLWEKPVTD